MNVPEPFVIEGASGQQLRELLRAARGHLHLTQREAAKRAGIDPSWWKKLENGSRSVTQASTIAAMCVAVQITPHKLESIGLPRLAFQVKTALAAKPLSSEEHIARAPGMSEHEKRMLIGLLRAMRVAGDGQKDPQKDPFSDHLRATITGSSGTARSRRRSSSQGPRK